MNEKNLETILAGKGIRKLEGVHWNFTTAALVEEAIRRREGHLAHMSALIVRTGFFTGRAANDKYLVDEPTSRDNIWWGKSNRPFPEAQFDELYRRVCTLYLEGRKIFVQDCLAGADTHYELPVRIITMDAWHNLFARNLFLRPIDLNDDRLTENTRGAYPITHIPNAIYPGIAGHPRTVIMLTADASFTAGQHLGRSRYRHRAGS
jgi:phosphoenolpyruvate carboxykinase (ATP)